MVATHRRVVAVRSSSARSRSDPMGKVTTGPNTPFPYGMKHSTRRRLPQHDNRDHLLHATRSSSPRAQQRQSRHTHFCMRSFSGLALLAYPSQEGRFTMTRIFETLTDILTGLGLLKPDV